MIELSLRVGGYRMTPMLAGGGDNALRNLIGVNMKVYSKFYILPVAFGLLATGAVAQEGALCEVKDSNDVISIALCPTAATKEQLSAAGAKICAERLPCGVWFWGDAEKMPSEAPANHDLLTQAQIISAQAVWVAEKNSLIQITKAE
jgi:hypothetical protein